MKIFKTILSAVLIALLGTVALWAYDASKRIVEYSREGYTAAYMVNQALTSIFEADGLHGIATTNRYQLQRKTKTIPLVTTSTGVDTLWMQLFTVPVGMTYTVESITLSAHVEIDEATDTLHLQIAYYDGTAKATLDTVVAKFCIDNDSAIVYADTIYTMTLLDTIFTAGDIVTSWLMAPGGAISAGDGAAITIKYREDE